MKAVFLLGLLAAAMGVPAAADAAMFDFSYATRIDSLSPTAISASGVITADDFGSGNGTFYISDITGQRGGVAISAFDFFQGSQTLQYNGSLQSADFTYQIGTDSFNVYEQGSDFYTEFMYPTDPPNSTGVGRSLASISITPSAVVPEPAAWAMMIGGVGLVGGAMRRRRSQPLHAAA